MNTQFGHWRQKPPLGTLLDPDWIAATGCIGCWAFNEGCGAVVNDLSGRANSAIATAYSGTSLPGWGGSTQGTASTLNGTSHYWTLPAATLTGQFPKATATLCVLLQLQAATPGGLGQTGFVRMTGTTDSGSSSHYPLTTGNLYVGTLRNDRQGPITPSSLVDRTKPHMATVTTKPGASGWAVYQNGIQLATATGVAAGSLSLDTTNGVYLGRSDNPGAGGAPYLLQGKLLGAWLFNQWMPQGVVVDFVANPWAGFLAPSARRWLTSTTNTLSPWGLLYGPQLGGSKAGVLPAGVM